MQLSALKDKFKLARSPVITLRINKFLTLSTTRRKLLLSGIFTAILLGIVLFNTAAFFKEGVPQGTLLYILCLISSILAGGIVFCKWEIPKRLERFLTFICMFLLPIGTMLMAECLNGVYIGNWLAAAWLFNCLFYALLYLLVYALSGSRRLPFLILNPIIYLLALTNHYVTAFRGTPFVPMDFYAIDTAATVAGGYDFSFNYQIVSATILFALLQVIAWKIKTPARKLWKKIILRGIAAALSLSVFINYYTSDVMADMGLSPDFFNQARGYQTLGVTMNFFMNTKYLSVKEPESYDANEIENIVYEVLEETEIQKSPPEKQRPNIICIMNETLADLNVLGDVKANKDYMPFLRSLKENTVKGNLYVPVIGAGTSNTEFEFLTGSSTAFVPSGSNVYTLFIKDKLASLTNTLKNQGYSATAFHPYLESNWNRINVYNHMGFDKYYGMESMFDSEIIKAYTEGCTFDELQNMFKEAYPEDDVLLRAFVSDSYDYKEVIKMYEERNNNTSFYIFNVTMQNHSPYDKKWPGYEEEIYLVDEKGKARTDYPETNQFLSLIYESDKAIQELINYFSAQEEPTIICMFGDHQPSIEDEYIAELLESESIYSLNIKQTQTRYVTPFYIWANYDIEEKEIDKLSVNYLSSYLMQTAGVEMPLFNQYLLKLSETLPVIDTVGYIDAQDKYFIYEQETPYTGLIEGYEKICYNYLFDKEDKCDWLFKIKE